MTTPETQDPKKWFVENPDKWSQVGDEIVFYVPEKEIPALALSAAKAYKESCDNFTKRAEILHSMGIGVADDWE